MANASKQTSLPKLSAAIQQTPEQSSGWFDWMPTWEGKKDVGTQPEDNNTGSAVNDAVPITDGRTRNAEDQWLANERFSDNSINWKFQLNPRNMIMSQFMSTLVDRNKLDNESINIYPDCIETDNGVTMTEDMATMLDRKKENTDLEKATKDITELKEKNATMLKELAFMKEMHLQNIIEDEMKNIKDTYMATVQNQQAKYQVVVEQFNDNMDKLMKTSNSRFSNGGEWKKEEEMFIKKELCMLRDNVYRMEQKTKTIDSSMSAQSVKLNKTIDKLQACTEKVSITSNNDFGSEADYKTVYNIRLDNLEKSVNALKSEKQSLILANRKMTKEIKSIKRKRSVSKKVFNAFRGQIKKDLDYVNRHTHSIEMHLNTPTKDRDNVNTKNIARHKYDKLKLRLSMVENKICEVGMTNQIKADQMMQNMMNMSYAYSSGRRNESTSELTNVHCDAYQRAYSPHSPSPSAHPKIPPPPPFQPPTPQAVCSTQYSRYTINSDLLKAMSKELRKPDSKNVRKIPRRGDMKIPSKVTTTAEQDVPLPSQALTLPLLAPDFPVEPTEPSASALTLVAPKSQVEPPALSEISITIDPESLVETPEPPAPTIKLVASESSVEPLVTSEISVTINPESRVETPEPPAPTIKLVASESYFEPLVTSEMSVTIDPESRVETPEPPAPKIKLVASVSSVEPLVTSEMSLIISPEPPKSPPPSIILTPTSSEENLAK